MNSSHSRDASSKKSPNTPEVTHKLAFHYLAFRIIHAPKLVFPTSAEIKVEEIQIELEKSVL